jgi:hypothetical protein
MYQRRGMGAWDECQGVGLPVILDIAIPYEAGYNAQLFSVASMTPAT